MGAQAIYMVDSKGLITTSRGDKLPSHKKQMARSDDTPNMKDLREIIEYVKPHALIGLSGAGPMFKQARPGLAEALGVADCLYMRQAACRSLHVFVKVLICRSPITSRSAMGHIKRGKGYAQCPSHKRRAVSTVGRAHL